MHPVISAWLALCARLDQQPRYDHADWAQWLADSEALSDWFNTVRRL